MLKNWLFYLLGLAGALVFHAYYFGWYSWFVLQLMVLLPLLSLLVSLPAMLQARVHVNVHAQCMKHEAAYAELQTRGGFMPLPHCSFRLRAESVMSGQSKLLRQQTSGRERWYVKLDTAHVGALRCRVERAWVYDYLKLFRIPVRTGSGVQLLVKPQAEQPPVLPNLTHFLTRQLRPKPGGGFSEEHEMRSYHPGDPLRSIHWKLSAKTDDLIVREAQEPVRGKVILTMDLVGDPEQIDDLMSWLRWLSGWLLEHDTPHSLIWIRPEDLQLGCVQITSEEELEAFVEQLLQTKLRQDLPSIARRRFPEAQWRYHITAEQEVKS